jgi:hypothetical protein
MAFVVPQCICSAASIPSFRRDAPSTDACRRYFGVAGEPLLTDFQSLFRPGTVLR